MYIPTSCSVLNTEITLFCLSISGSCMTTVSVSPGLASAYMKYPSFSSMGITVPSSRSRPASSFRISTLLFHGENSSLLVTCNIKNTRNSRLTAIIKKFSRYFVNLLFIFYIPDLCLIYQISNNQHAVLHRIIQYMAYFFHVFFLQMC